MIRVHRLAPAVILALVLTPSLARSEWEPLAIGNRWEYRGTGGSHQVESITGQIPLRGRVVAIKSYAEGADAGLENYWLLDADGSVLLAGFTAPDGTAVAYEPPIRYLNTPPAVGVKPIQLVTAYDLHTNAVMFTDYFRYDITEDVLLSLPAGALHALGVGTIESTGPLGARRTLALDGRALPGARSPQATTYTSDWFSEGVGVVQYNTTDLYQLVGFGRPTAVLASSWGAVKRLYR
jgi:hypothetical protein